MHIFLFLAAILDAILDSSIRNTIATMINRFLDLENKQDI